MADDKIKISELSETTELFDGCCMPIVQNDETKKVKYKTIRKKIIEAVQDEIEFEGAIIDHDTSHESHPDIRIELSKINRKIDSSVDVNVADVYVDGESVLDEDKIAQIDLSPFAKHSIYYGVCTDSGTNRNVTVDDSFTLTEGVIVIVKFANAFNTGIKLNVNGSGAKTVKNADGGSTNYILCRPNQTAPIVYNGTDWIFGFANASTSYPGMVRLDNTHTSSSVVLASTAKALKDVYDELDARISALENN